MIKSFQQEPTEIVSFPHGVKVLVRENGGTTPKNRMAILMQYRKHDFVIGMRGRFHEWGLALTRGAKRADIARWGLERGIVEHQIELSKLRLIFSTKTKKHIQIGQNLYPQN